MQIETTMTEKDKKLLIALAAVIIFAGFFMFLIKPTISDIMDVKAKLNEAEMKQHQIQYGIDRIPEIRKDIVDLKADFKEQSKDYYYNLQSQDIDNLLTGMALKHGFSQNELKELRIDYPTEYAKVFEYLSAEAQQAAEDTNTESTADGKDDSAAKGELQGVYGVNVSFKINGTRTKIQPFLDKLVNDYKAIHVTGYNWQLGAGEHTSQYVLTVEMTIYTTSKVELKEVE